jgi:GNAT superfamily N-acetyltransferase
MTLGVSERAQPEDVCFLEERINAYNVERTQIADGTDVAIFVRDTDGTILAGLYGWTWGGCLEIESLWVHESLRGKGYGSELLRTAEQTALARGCRLALLDTHSFQAPAFYLKRGYAIFGVLDDYPVGYQKYYLKKPLQ